MVLFIWVDNKLVSMNLLLKLYFPDKTCDRTVGIYYLYTRVKGKA